MLFCCFFLADKQFKPTYTTLTFNKSILLWKWCIYELVNKGNIIRSICRRNVTDLTTHQMLLLVLGVNTWEIPIFFCSVRFCWSGNRISYWASKVILGDGTTEDDRKLQQLWAVYRNFIFLATRVTRFESSSNDSIDAGSCKSCY